MWKDLGGISSSLPSYTTYASGKLYHWNYPKGANGDAQPVNSLLSLGEFNKVVPKSNNVWNKGCDVNYDHLGDYLGWPQKNSSYPFFDEFIADSAITDLRAAAKAKGKFFVGVGFHQPHAPWY